jgi:hypothetical protein
MSLAPAGKNARRMAGRQIVATAAATLAAVRADKGIGLLLGNCS